MDEPMSPTTALSPEAIEAEVIETLRTCYDPEIPVNIYDLGLIYDISLDEANHLSIRMTLTSPMCPVAGTLPPEVQRKTEAVPGVASSKVELVWDPPWTQEMMGESAKLKLGLDL
jgi:FeS assembly SUF system protein